jgi:hypothetical protein
MNSPTPKNGIKALFLVRNCPWPNLKVRMSIGLESFSCVLRNFDP